MVFRTSVLFHQVSGFPGSSRLSLPVDVGRAFKMKVVDIEEWDRSEQYKFFSQMDEPKWGVTVEMDCSKAYAKAKKRRCSFYLLYLYYSLKAANAVEAFRYRINEDGNVVLYDRVNGSATVDRPNGTFGYGYMDYFEEFSEFEETARVEIEKVRAETDLRISNGSNNLIYYSTLPWLKFTSLSHAHSFNKKDSIPQITFGKLSQDGKKWMMPLSVSVHHGLVDGSHVGAYVERFQSLIDED